MADEAGGRMTLGRWGLWTAGSALLAFAIWFLEGKALEAVSRRDLGWVPGPFAALEDWVFDAQWAIALIIFLIAELPALLWRRRGGGLAGTLGVAVAVPLAVFAPALVPKGYPEDRLIPFILLAIGLLATAVAALICVFVRPAEEPD